MPWPPQMHDSARYSAAQLTADINRWLLETAVDEEVVFGMWIHMTEQLSSDALQG